MESGKYHSHCKYFKAKTHKGKALLRHNRNHCPGVDLDGHWIHSPLLLWDPRRGTCLAMVHPRKEFVCQLVELHMSTETVLGTSRAWGGQADTVQNRNLAGATLLASATPRVCHPIQALLWERWMWVHIPKRGGHFLPANLDFSTGNMIKNADWNFAQSKARASSVHPFSLFTVQLKTLSPSSWTHSPVAGSAIPASQFSLTAVCATGRPVIFFCGYSHTRAPQCGGFKLSWRFSRIESVALCPTFLQPEPRPCSPRSRRKPSDTLFDLLLWWFLCNQSCCCCGNETQQRDSSNYLNGKNLPFGAPRSLLFSSTLHHQLAVVVWITSGFQLHP